MFAHPDFLFGGRVIRIPIRLDDKCLEALRVLARREFRDVRQQAAWIIEQELTQLGLLGDEELATPNRSSTQEGQNVTG